LTDRAASLLSLKERKDGQEAPGLKLSALMTTASGLGAMPRRQGNEALKTNNLLDLTPKPPNYRE